MKFTIIQLKHFMATLYNVMTLRAFK